MLVHSCLFCPAQFIATYCLHVYCSVWANKI